ncbi:cysteine proteinase [Obba rivulosa]|uniref:ubiquitinyl hydrolase 1 n=1 Tax=Obba rivulosa TaxID=1052685 RepID=A0A8E2ASG6_9APHY|nr:cysteine proteinase [Obba rivulosa]
MPGVTVLPPSPALAGFGATFPSIPAMQNGSGVGPRETVAEIKEHAKEQVRRVHGASATSLLRSARDQIQFAGAREREGDLRGALSALTKAASLIQMFMNSPELKQDRRGPLLKEFADFQQHEGQDLPVKMEHIELKLMEAERERPAPAHEPRAESEADTPVRTGGTSIADRMRSLQSAGLAVSTTKRLSRDIPTGTPPMSPDVTRPSNRLSLQPVPSPSLAASALAIPAPPAVTTTSTLGTPPAPSPHALVPTSSLGPPSPASSASSSPRISHFNVAEFTQAFPSIDELDEIGGFRLPSAPTGTSIGSGSGSAAGSRKPSVADMRSPFVPSKAFPALPLDPGPRPSSTPIPSSMDTFLSRPSSPTRSPLSSTVPRKPSGLSLRTSPSRSPVIPAATPGTEKPELPLTTLFPRTLYEYKNKPNIKVLVLDVRTREEFEREHIKADAVVCIEPSVLLRDNVTSQTIQDSLAVGPRDESVLFHNRDKFDLVAVHDDASDTLGDARSPLATLVQAIYVQEFRKILRNAPMVLIGGLQAWKRELGEDELVRGAPALTQRHVNGTAVNGVKSMNGAGRPPPVNAQTRPVSSAHVRNPAESSASASSTTTGTVLETLVSRGRAEPEVNGHKLWIPSANARPSPDLPTTSARPTVDLSQPLSPTLDSPKRLTRKPAISRPSSGSISYSYSPTIPENGFTQHFSSPMISGSSPIQYPQVSRTISPQVSGSSFSSPSNLQGLVSLPPQASINPSPLSRRRSDYIDQSQEALSGFTARTPIDYPDLSAQHVLRPPPAAASSGMERQDNRPRIVQSQSYALQTGPRPPTIQSDYPVTYWADLQIGTSGLKNLGNTCYMNSTIQCLSATVPFARFFTDGRWKSAVNMVNPLGTKGALAHAFAGTLRDMWQGELQCLNPAAFRRLMCTYAPQFGGNEQHDSQEFLTSLLDGLHEDLNRVLHKPHIQSTPAQEAELERLPTQVASEQEWQIYRMRNDSLVVDFFQGQFRNRLECLTCHKTSTTYNAFMYLTLPIPSNRSGSRVTLQQCLDAFVKEEVMEKSDAWNCPHCKTLRKATKRLSLSRLPPVLLIHLKRFSAKGPFTDKIETFVDFPLRNLDLTNYMPPPLPPGVSGGPTVSREDPRCQMPPYKYDLYGVTNHFGTLSGGHYTAFISSRGGWLYCDDSRVTQADAKDVVGRPAYILFYKRTKA